MSLHTSFFGTLTTETCPSPNRASTHTVRQVQCKSKCTQISIAFLEGACVVGDIKHHVVECRPVNFLGIRSGRYLHCFLKTIPTEPIMD